MQGTVIIHATTSHQTTIAIHGWFVFHAAAEREYYSNHMLCLQVHHQVAGTICDHSQLLQCARVVAWLEALFRKSQDYQSEQEQGISCAHLLKRLP